MAAHDVVSTQAALIVAALRLVDDHPDIPAGSVLRCFSRAVVITRRSGTPSGSLAEEAELLARRLLAARNRPGLPGAPPRQRRDTSSELDAVPA